MMTADLPVLFPICHSDSLKFFAEVAGTSSAYLPDGFPDNQYCENLYD